MTNQLIQAFLDKVDHDPEMRAHLKAAGDIGALSVEQVALMAQQEGFSITGSDLIRHQLELLGQEDDGEELEALWKRLCGRRGMHLLRRHWH